MPGKPSRSLPSRGLLYGGLALLTLVIHGYHPFAEDGGLYLAGVEWRLHPQLFPHGTAFVTEHLRFSAFAWLMAGIVRATHLPLAWCVLLVYFLATVLTFAAADSLLQRIAPPAGDLPGQLGGLGLLAVWWTLPVAGTSLSLFDPYLTARSLSTPLCLLALACAFAAGPGARAGTRWFAGMCAGLCLLLAGALHPLMTGYTLGLLLFLAAIQVRPSSHPARWCAALVLGALVLAAALQSTAAPESAAAHAADLTRYYWFLSRWQWYEWLGLAGPALVLLPLLYLPRLRAGVTNPGGRHLAWACLALAGTAVLVALLFAQRSSGVHAVARLQPLRAFLLVYAVMILLLGSTAVSWCSARWQNQSRRARFLPAGIPAAAGALLAAVMVLVARSVYPASNHLELPWRMARSPNAWVQAFLWCRNHTPEEALFALDARYITYPGEDAQTFRALAERSALPDFSKDGGEAAITPALAPRWQAGETAQADLNTLADAERKARLQPFGVGWLVLPSASATHLPCPYQNNAVKVCRL